MAAATTWERYVILNVDAKKYDSRYSKVEKDG